MRAAEGVTNADPDSHADNDNNHADDHADADDPSRNDASCNDASNDRPGVNVRDPSVNLAIAIAGHLTLKRHDIGAREPVHDSRDRNQWHADDGRRTDRLLRGHRDHGDP